MSDRKLLVVDAEAAKICRDLAQFMWASRPSQCPPSTGEAICALTPAPEGDAVPVDDDPTVDALVNLAFCTDRMREAIVRHIRASFADPRAVEAVAPFTNGGDDDADVQRERARRGLAAACEAVLGKEGGE